MLRGWREQRRRQAEERAAETKRNLLEMWHKVAPVEHRVSEVEPYELPEALRKFRDGPVIAKCSCGQPFTTVQDARYHERVGGPNDERLAQELRHRWFPNGPPHGVD